MKIFSFAIHSLIALILAVSLHSHAEEKKKAAEKTASKAPVVVMDTTLGKIKIELMPEEAPETVKNFLQYVEDGFYAGTIFHRVIPGFVVQGGGLTYDFKRKKTRDPVKNEAKNNIKNLKWTLSMARTSDPDSASSQFFINLADNENLDKNVKLNSAGYAVFGKVIDGFDVVEKIVREPRGLFRAHPDAPNYAVSVKSAYREK